MAKKAAKKPIDLGKFFDSRGVWALKGKTIMIGTLIMKVDSAHRDGEVIFIHLKECGFANEIKFIFSSNTYKFLKGDTIPRDWSGETILVK